MKLNRVFIAGLVFTLGSSFFLSRPSFASWEADVLEMNKESKVSELVTAASDGKIDRIHFLLSHGVDPNAATSAGLTPLIAAGQKRQWDAVKALVLAKADLSVRDPENDCPVLFAAVFSGKDEIVSFLLEHGASVKFQNKYGTTALSTALRKGFFEISQLLIEKGADVNVETASLTPLDRGVLSGNPALVTLLLKSGASVRGPLQSSALAKAIEAGNVEIVQRLLEHPEMDLKAQDPMGQTALFYAIRFRNLEIFRMLLGKTVFDINEQDKNGNSLLHFAVDANRPDLVNELLAVPGINPNLSNKAGVTPLAVASFNMNTQIVIQLLAAGADPNLPKNRPLENSVLELSPFNSQILLSAGADPRFLETDPKYLPYLRENTGVPFSDFSYFYGQSKVIEKQGSPLIERAKLFLRARLKIGPFHSKPIARQLYDQMVSFLFAYEKDSTVVSKELEKLSVFPKTVYYRAGSAVPGGWKLPFPIELHQEQESAEVELILHVKGTKDENGKTHGDPNFYGGFKNVYVSWNFTKGSPLVLMNLRKNAKNKKSEFKREFEIQSALQGKGIVDPGHFFEYEGSKSKKVALVQPLLGNSLEKVMRRSTKGIFQTFEPIFVALNEIHKKGIVHGDIKPSNILLDADERGHLADFGGAVKVGEKLGALTFEFLAPEFYKNPSSPVLADPALDVFALGMTLYYYITNRNPFSELPRADLTQILSKAHTLEDLKLIWISCAPPYRHPLEELICQMLTPQPQERISSQDALDRFLEIKKTQGSQEFKLSEFQFSKLLAPRWEIEVLKKDKEALIDELIKVVRSGETRKMKYLLSKGVNPNSKDASGKTPLFVAAKAQQWRAVQELILNGADPSLVDTYRGHPILSIAVFYKNLEMVSWLLAHGAPVNLQDSGGYSALDTAINHDLPQMAELLVKNGGKTFIFEVDPDEDEDEDKN